MDTGSGMKEKKFTWPSHFKKTNSKELGGFFFAAILAVCYEFLSWLQSLRTVRD